MRSVAHSLYFLPPRPGSGPRARAHVSSWRMTAEEAAGIGALAIVPGSTEFRQVPETDEERQRTQVNYQSAGHDGVKPPRK